jgi:hypothetical protein
MNNLPEDSTVFLRVKPQIRAEEVLNSMKDAAKVKTVAFTLKTLLKVSMEFLYFYSFSCLRILILQTISLQLEELLPF